MSQNPDIASLFHDRPPERFLDRRIDVEMLRAMEQAGATAGLIIAVVRQPMVKDGKPAKAKSKDRRRVKS